MEEKLINFIINSCYRDTLDYKKYVEDLGRRIEYSGQWSYITEIMIITIKSLIPFEDVVGVGIDYERFYEELKLWQYYKHGSNNLIDDAIRGKKNNNYWLEGDNSIPSRIFPIVASNKEWKVAKEELIKNILYTSGNIKNLLEYLAISKVLFLLIRDNGIDYDNVLDEIKEEIITFSQVEFVKKYEKNFRMDIDTYNGNFTIDFERERVKLINLFNGIYNKGNFDSLYTALQIIKKEDKDLGKGYDNFILCGIKGMLEDKIINDEIKDRSFIESLGSYIYKLRRGRVSPESLRIKKYKLPDVFSFNKGEEFSHSLLNRARVLSREEKLKYIISYIVTKAGIYRFYKAK